MNIHQQTTLLFRLLCLGPLITLVSFTALADQVITDDVVIKGSMCVGTQCSDNQDFGFDTVIYQSDDPSIRFQDTSITATFPTSDWVLGFTDEGSTVIPYFYLRDEDQGVNLLVLQSGNSGGVALGAQSTVESDAISVGNSDNTRRIMFVADGIDDSDAVTMGQFTTFTTTAQTNTATEISDLNSNISDVQTSISALQVRIDALTDRLDALTP